MQFVFCSKCLQGFHIGECENQPSTSAASSSGRDSYVIDPLKAKDVSMLLLTLESFYKII